MSRVVSLYLPTWPTDRLRRKMDAAAPDPAMPLVLVAPTGRRREVVAANGAAIRIGRRVGMLGTKAQALVKELVIHHADPAADGEALERLAVWALRYSRSRCAPLPRAPCQISGKQSPTLSNASHPMNVKIISPPLDTTQPDRKML